MQILRVILIAVFVSGYKPLRKHNQTPKSSFHEISVSITLVHALVGIGAIGWLTPKSFIDTIVVSRLTIGLLMVPVFAILYPLTSKMYRHLIVKGRSREFRSVMNSKSWLVGKALYIYLMFGMMLTLLFMGMSDWAK